VKLTSYFQKLLLILQSQLFLKRHFLEPNLYLFNLKQSQLPQVNRVLFFLNHAEFMHVGDHLFFLPLIRSFIDAGYETEICVSPLMIPFFERLNLPIVPEPKSFTEYDLVVSRFELIPLLSKNQALFVHVSKHLTMPICSQLLSTFSQYFHRSFHSQLDYSVFSEPEILTLLNLPTDQEFILFNSYCDSSSYLATGRKKDLLISHAKAKAEELNCQVVFLGTQNDKDTDHSDYPFPFIDLRGKTSIVEVFQLVRSPKVVLYIGFDAFIMHAMSLAGKRSLVKFRGRLTRKQAVMLEKYHVRLFAGDQLVTLI